MNTKLFIGLIICSLGLPARADQIIMQNGDRYHGTVVAVTTNALVLKSAILGTVNLSRGDVAQINFGSNVVAQAKPEAASAHAPNPSGTLNPAVRQLQSQPHLIQQVQNQYLSDASPAAKAKFDQMLSDLSTGKMSVNDLRGEAKSAADQLRALRKELGEDAGEGLDGYLTILDNFIQTTAPTSVTNAATGNK